ncbi:unnamed protein product [Rhizophagus irregularis]|nr:unnamed protein product [Rhizophagus irregularis]
MTDSYLVRVGGKVFEFSETSLQTDAPNLFTEMLWGGEVYGEKEIFFDRDPVIFERCKIFQLSKLSESMITLDTRIGDIFNSHFKIEKRLTDIDPLLLQLKRFGDKQYVIYKSEGMPVVLFHMGGVICDVSPLNSIEWKFQPVNLEHSRIIRDIIINVIGEDYDQKNDIFNGIKSVSAFEIDGQKVYGKVINEHQQSNPIGGSSAGGKIKHRIKPVWGTGITEPTWLAHRGT